MPVLFPTPTNQTTITDWYFRYFPRTPLVMLHGGQLKHAIKRGAGWRADCFGDYGFFASDWNHMEHGYPHVFVDPVVADAWKRGPVQLEVCGVVQDWYDKGFDLDRILQKGLDWHVSVLNAKSSPIPLDWRPQFDEFLKKLGYRFVLREFTHPSAATPGAELALRSSWDNVGVAPIYHPWPLAYRLRSSTGHVIAQWTSQSDLKGWLPGRRQTADDRVRLPNDLAAGRYALDVAILDQAGGSPYVQLAIEGRRSDGWYALSRLEIRP